MWESAEPADLSEGKSHVEWVHGCRDGSMAGILAGPQQSKSLRVTTARLLALLLKNALTHRRRIEITGMISESQRKNV